MKDFNWKLFWKNIVFAIPAITVAVWMIYQAYGIQSVVWFLFFFCVATFLLAICIICLGLKPGKNKAEKIWRVVHIDTVVTVTDIHHTDSETIVTFHETKYGDSDSRIVVLLRPQYNLHVWTDYFVGDDYQLHHYSDNDFKPR